MISRTAVLERSLQCLFRRLSTSAPVATKRTCLYDLHVQNGGKMVAFAGFEMPVQYGNYSIADSTVHTRSHVSIFDVSHMLQTKIFGKDRIKFIESITTADAEGLEPNQGTLSVFTNDNGGIRDDLIFTKTDQGYIYMVTNAGCVDKDLPYLMEKAKEFREKGGDVEVKALEGRGLVAVQGPEMVNILQPETDINLTDLYFMHSTIGTVCGIPDCRVTRCGYTGEDGVEISVDPKHAPQLVNKLLQSPNASVKLAGLGARDALRLEAGLCLYGNDIDESTTPVEAGLLFVIGKRRRVAKDFPGAKKIVSQIINKNCPKKRVGLIAEPGRAPRSHLPILDPLDRASVGFVTSGSPSPCLKRNIAIGYVDGPMATAGRKFAVDFGNRTVLVTVTKMPFVPTNYYTKQTKKNRI